MYRRQPGEEAARQRVILTEGTEFVKVKKENPKGTVREQKVIAIGYRKLSGGERERQDWECRQEPGKSYIGVDFLLLAMGAIGMSVREVTASYLYFKGCLCLQSEGGAQAECGVRATSPEARTLIHMGEVVTQAKPGQWESTARGKLEREYKAEQTRPGDRLDMGCRRESRQDDPQVLTWVTPWLAHGTIHRGGELRGQGTDDELNISGSNFPRS